MGEPVKKENVIRSEFGKENRIITPDQIRAQSCFDEINASLIRYNCAFIPQVTITGNGAVSGGFAIVANKKVIKNG